MGSDPGDDLQVTHPIHIFGLFAIRAADFRLHFIEGEALQGQKRPGHVFDHQLGLFPGLSSYPAVDRQRGVTPGEIARGPFGTKQTLFYTRAIMAVWFCSAVSYIFLILPPSL